MNKFMPYVMPMRCDACNTFADELDVTNADRFVKSQINRILLYHTKARKR